METIVIGCRWTFMCLVALLSYSSPTLAGTDLKLVQTGKGVYSLQGTNFKGVAGTDVIIQYDKRLLGNPRIAWGNLATGQVVANTNQSGQVHIAAVDVNAGAGAPGTGTFATITFDVVGNPAGNITATANLIDINGAFLATPVSAAPVVYNVGTATSATDSGTDSFGVSAQTSATASSSGTETSAGANITAPRYGWGTISFEGSTPADKKKEEPSAPAPGPAQQMEQPTAATNYEEPQTDREPVKPVKNSERKLVRIRSVLDEFRLFQGKKTPEALQALFKKPEDVKQEPPVALSDGGSKVTLLLGRCAPEKQTPNFLPQGAKIISLKTSENCAWVVELLPDKGVYEATVTLTEDDVEQVIPLKVAPPLPAGSEIGMNGKLTETDFHLFLKKRGTVKLPSFDLNGDGKRDYIDDYIFTANFIAKNGHK